MFSSQGQTNFKNIILNQNFVTLRHWIKQRITAVILLPLVITLIFFFVSEFIGGGAFQGLLFDVYNPISVLLSFVSLFTHPFYSFIFLLTSFLILIHLKEGVENIIQDYVHNEKTKVFSFILLQCSLIELFKYIYIYVEILPLGT